MKRCDITLLLCGVYSVLLVTLASCRGTTAAPAAAPTTAPAAVGTVTPEPTPIVTADERVVVELYRHLSSGLTLFNPPKEMRVAVPEIVTYRVEYGEGVSRETIVEGLPTKDRQVIADTVSISSRMTAVLTGDAFEIVPLHSSDEKFIVPNEPNDWSWRVTPTRSGVHKLTIRLTALIQVGQEKIPRDFPVDEKSVIVHVNWSNLFLGILNNPWTQGTAALVVLLGVAFGMYDLVRRRRGGAQRLAPPGLSSDRDYLESLIVSTERRLRVLEQQQAVHGVDTPPEVVLEIEDLQKKLVELEEQRTRYKDEDTGG